MLVVGACCFVQSLEELEARISVREAANLTEVSRMKERVTRQQAELTKLTRENTGLLENIGQLTAKQQRLEKELNAAGGVHVSDGGPAQRKEAEERARLLQLVKLQAKEMEALKAEIGMLRRKGGHVYTPAVPPPMPMGMPMEATMGSSQMMEMSESKMHGGK